MKDKDTPPRASGVSKRGFASMDPERQREIARKGGASVPSGKRSFSQDRSLAAQAGRKGGEASKGARRRETSPQEPAPERPRPQRDF
ncbi:MAG: general stress protein [Patescibacteria group bacterium]